MLYFDHNAGSPLCPAARDAWLDASERWIANPSSPHRLGSRASAALEEARSRLATILGCDPLDLVWTSGASESNNHLIQHLAASLPTDRPVWISAVEHPCLLLPAQQLFGDRLRLLPVNAEGCLERTVLGAMLKNGPPPGAVICMAANNETGVVQPWETVRSWCREHGIPMVCDAVQWLGKLPARGLGECDYLSGSGHKFGGPRGIGFLKVPSRGRVRSLLLGGPQEEGRRAGTENVAGALAMVAALESRERMMQDPQSLSERRAWKGEWEHRIAGEIPELRILSERAERLWNTVAVLMPGGDCRQRWVVRLDRLGIAASTGSACASGTEEPSHVIRAMGIPDSDAGRVLRFSSGWETTSKDWDQLAEAVIRVVRENVLAPKS